jgi:hypothetical protein
MLRKGDTVMGRIFFVVLFIMLQISAGTAFANGWMGESPALKSGNLVAPPGLVLVSERVSIVLLEKEYKTMVTYQLSSGKGPFSGTLYFPVLCRQREEQTSDVPCVSDYKVTLDGHTAPANKEPAEVLGSLEAAFKTRVYDPKLVKDYVDLSSYEDLNTGSDNLVQVFSSMVQSDKKDFLLTISYRQPYYYSSSGSTMSSMNSYSDDLVYYDFSPAASWMRGPVPSIQVEVDARAAAGTLRFPGGWSFATAKGMYAAERKNSGFTDVPPLVIAVDRKNRQQYQNHKRTPNPRISWQLASPDTLAHANNAYAPAKAMDDNLNTSWCSGKDQPEIVMAIAPVSQAEADQNTPCVFEGLGMINGYMKTAERFEANRRVKSGVIEIESVMKGKFSLPDPDMARAFDPFQALDFILLQDERSLRLVEPKGKSVRQITSRESFKVRLKILEVYQGKKDTDVCITELYPVFNCF